MDFISNITHITNLLFNSLSSSFLSFIDLFCFLGERAGEAAHRLIQLFHQRGGKTRLPYEWLCESGFSCILNMNVLFFLDKENNESQWEDHKWCWSHVVPQVSHTNCHRLRWPTVVWCMWFTDVPEAASSFSFESKCWNVFIQIPQYLRRHAWRWRKLQRHQTSIPSWGELTLLCNIKDFEPFKKLNRLSNVGWVVGQHF